jgi:hypothetical protein
LVLLLPAQRHIDPVTHHISRLLTWLGRLVWR